MKGNLANSETLHRLHPGLATLIEVGILFLSGIPAFFWLWPNVQGTSWNTAVQILAYIYMLAGSFILFHIGWHSPLQLLAVLILGLVLATIRWRAGGILSLIFTHGLIDVGAVWMLPELHLEELGRLEIVHPGALFLRYAFILGIPLYRWLLYPHFQAARKIRCRNTL